MAELQVQTPVPARWRILFAALLVLAFWFAGWTLMRKDAPDAAPVGVKDGQDARIRLQTAAIAFASGKLAPKVLILTDWPELYRKQDGTYPEFLYFQDNLSVVDPASVPGWGLGGPRETFSHFRLLYSSGREQHDAEQEKQFNKLPENSLGTFRLNPAFDVVLLDCAFPERLLSRKLRLFSPAFFDRVKSGLLNSGGVFAVVLPPDRAEDSACILAFLRHSFGNAGAFCFGERVILASTPDAEANFDLDRLNATAGLAGYYTDGVPGNAISLILDENYSDSIPAGLLETAADIRIPRVFTPYCAVFARERLLPKLMRFLPQGFPLQTVCAWILGILLAVYPFLRYFISWKPVHKQAFRAFEDMFYLTGALSLFLMFTHEMMPDDALQFALYLVILGFLFYGTLGKSLKHFKFVSMLDNPFGRVLFGLLAPIFFGLAFFLPPTGFLTEFLALCGLIAASLLVRARMTEPVQPGPAIPLAFVLGIAASLTVFAVSLCFPLGPAVFAAVACVYRLILLD